jgi:hypothetical protein
MAGRSGKLQTHRIVTSQPPAIDAIPRRDLRSPSESPPENVIWAQEIFPIEDSIVPKQPRCDNRRDLDPVTINYSLFKNLTFVVGTETDQKSRL